MSQLLWIFFLYFHQYHCVDTTDNTTIDTLCDSEGICDNVSSIMQFNISHDSDYENEEVLKNFLNISTLKPKVRGKVDETPVDVARPETVKLMTAVNACPCDLLPSACDVNCCCDPDCKEYHLAAFSHCYSYRESSKIYDNRYCYTKNFIKKNNTQFILDRLSDNLFCIAYDNLPPVYSSVTMIDVKNRQEFDEIVKNQDDERTAPISQWTEELYEGIEIDRVNGSYIYGDLLWRYDQGIVKTVDIPFSGFTSQCSLKKTLKYLEDFSSFCLQTQLSNTNRFLFAETYTNISLIRNSLFLQNLTLKSTECPKNVCIKIDVNFCTNSTPCNNTDAPTATCSNNTCYNIVNTIRYTIYHNGTTGIKQILAHVQLANASTHFHQHFHIKYQWMDQANKQTIAARSGNPGYLVGKPIITGTLVSSNLTKNSIIRKIVVNSTNNFLTIPLADKMGQCFGADGERFVVGFGEDIKSRCSVKVVTKIFSPKSCANLADQIVTIFFGNSLTNITQIDNYKIYISKSSNISHNVSNWAQIFLNKLPRNTANGEIKFNGKISCTGVITSLRIDIVYSILPKIHAKQHYKIIGVGFSVVDDIPLQWDKCSDKDCTDILDVNLVTYVKFHDISTPSMYYYAGGPNLDISLPYEFFYPFLSTTAYNTAPTAEINIFSGNYWFILCFYCFYHFNVLTIY